MVISIKNKVKKKKEKPVAPVGCMNICFAFHSLLDISIDIHGGFCCPLSQKPRTVLSALRWFEKCVVLDFTFFPDSDVRLGSVAVSSQTFAIIFAARSQKSFCLMLRNFRLYITCNIIYQNYFHNGNLYLIYHNITKMT